MPDKSADDIVTETVTDGAETQQLRDTVEALAAQVQELIRQAKAPQAPTNLPIALTPKQRIKQMSAGQSLSATDTLNDLSKRVDTLGLVGGFRPNDIVVLTAEDKLKLLYASKSVKLEEGEPLYGVVRALMYARRRDRKRKYRVAFPTLGKSFDDGVMEYEMELVEAAQ